MQTATNPRSRSSSVTRGSPSDHVTRATAGDPLMVRPKSMSRPKTAGTAAEVPQFVITSFSEHVKDKVKDSISSKQAEEAVKKATPNLASSGKPHSPVTRASSTLPTLEPSKSTSKTALNGHTTPLPRPNSAKLLGVSNGNHTNNNTSGDNASVLSAHSAKSDSKQNHLNQKSNSFASTSSRSPSFTENGVLTKRRLSIFANSAGHSETSSISSDQRLCDSNNSDTDSISHEKDMLSKESQVTDDSDLFTRRVSMLTGDEDKNQAPSPNTLRPLNVASKNTIGSKTSIGSLGASSIQEEELPPETNVLSGSHFDGPTKIEAFPSAPASTTPKADMISRPRARTFNGPSESQTEPPHIRRLSINRGVSLLQTSSPEVRRASIAPDEPEQSEELLNPLLSRPTSATRRSSDPNRNNPMSANRRASRRDTIINIFQQKMNATKHTMIAEASYIRRPLSTENMANWTKFNRVVKWAYRLAMLGRHIINTKMRAIANPSNQKQQTLTQMLKVTPTKLDNDYLGKIETLLSKLGGTRSYIEMEEVEKLLLLRVKDYEKFNEAERSKICQIVRFDAYPKDTVILWEEHIVTCFYFVLSGQLEIFKLNQGTKLPLVLWNQGMALGHARIKVENATRSACATTTVDTVLLTVDRVDYMQIVQQVELDLHPKLLLLANMSLFEREKDFFNKVSPLMKVQHFQKDQVIVEENAQIERMYWIISGDCVVSKVVPFVSIPVFVPNGKTTKTILEAYTGQQLGADDKRVDYKLEVQDMTNGDWFPSLDYLGTNKELLRYDGPEKLQKEAYINHYGKMIIRSDSTIKANTKMIVASVPFFDFFNQCSKEVLFKLITEPCKHQYSLSVLQEQFLAQKSWESHRKHVVDELNFD